MRIIGGYKEENMYIIKFRKDSGEYITMEIRPIDFGMDGVEEYIQIRLPRHQPVIRFIGGNNAIILDADNL